MLSDVGGERERVRERYIYLLSIPLVVYVVYFFCLREQALYGMFGGTVSYSELMKGRAGQISSPDCSIAIEPFISLNSSLEILRFVKFTE